MEFIKWYMQVQTQGLYFILIILALFAVACIYPYFIKYLSKRY